MDPFLIPELIHLVLNVCSLLMHGIGLLLLLSLYHLPGRRKTVNQLLLINLSLSVTVKNTLAVIGCVTGFLFSTNGSEVLKVVSYYVRLADSSSGLYQYYMSIVFIIVDQLLILRLETRYSSICTIRRAIRSLLAIWTINVLILGFVVIGDLLATDINMFLDWLDLYLPSIFDIFFLFFSATCYTVMFFRFASTQRRESLVKNKKVKKSLFEIFRKSKFNHSLLLVMTSLLLTTIPGLIISGLQVTKTELPVSVVYYAITSIGFNYLVDGFIYIFLRKSVRRHFVHICTRCCVTVSNDRKRVRKTVSSSSANQKERFEMFQKNDCGTQSLHTTNILEIGESSQKQTLVCTWGNSSFSFEL